MLISLVSACADVRVSFNGTMAGCAGQWLAFLPDLLSPVRSHGPPAGVKCFIDRPGALVMRHSLRKNMRIAIIMPVLNEAASIGAALGALAPLQAAGCEVIVADGGSEDGTAALALPLADSVIPAPRGRASQMNAGAGQCTAPVLLFLHADTRLPPQAPELIAQAMAKGGLWGRFDVHIEGRSPALKIV
ncbi:MAG: glycosyltransferase, partial [Alphaproteobacteria bacterium]|nr:glycosyltransferase [Alphaproteobacteria bacterium]